MGGGARKPVPDPTGYDLDHFFLQMDGAAVFKHAIIGFSEQIHQTLARENLKPEDIAWVVPHQANERILAGEQAGRDPLRQVRDDDRPVRQHERGQRLDGAGLGRRGGDLQSRATGSSSAASAPG